MPVSGKAEPITYTAGEALAEKRRVQISAGSTTSPPEVIYADDTEEGIGFVEYETADTELTAVRPYTDSGLKEAVAAGAIAVGDILYAAADGKVASTGTVLLRLVAHTAAAADGDFLEVVNY